MSLEPTRTQSTPQPVNHQPTPQEDLAFMETHHLLALTHSASDVSRYLPRRDARQRSASTYGSCLEIGDAADLRKPIGVERQGERLEPARYYGGFLANALCFCLALSPACSRERSPNRPALSNTCTEEGARCQVRPGVLGVCTATTMAGCNDPSCLRCAAQH